jgi:hypothetical protein
MNKRIDQLLVKAGAYFGAEGVLYDEFDPKKFAQLIIAECGGIYESIDNGNKPEGTDDYFKAVRRRFGVKR